LNIDSYSRGYSTTNCKFSILFDCHGAGKITHGPFFC
jgi:hypothetical protein